MADPERADRDETYVDGAYEDGAYEDGAHPDEVQPNVAHPTSLTKAPVIEMHEPESGQTWATTTVDLLAALDFYDFD
jgi:hypothetical protein